MATVTSAIESLKTKKTKRLINCLEQINNKTITSVKLERIHLLETLRLVYEIIVKNPEFSIELVNSHNLNELITRLTSEKFFKLEIASFFLFHFLFFSYLLSLFIVFMVKCNKSPDNYPITIFPKSPDNKTTAIIGIPFCSVLYEEKRHFEKDTPFGIITQIVLISYILIEVLMMLVNGISKILRLFKNGTKLERPFIILKIISPIVPLVLLYFLASYIFQIYVKFITYNTKEPFAILSFFSDIKKANQYFGDTLIIQVLTFYSIIKLLEKLKMCYIFGRCLIKHSSAVKNFVTISAIATFLQKLYSSVNSSLSDSILPVYYSTSSFWNMSHKITIKELFDLNMNISKEYSAELNAYTYDNSLIERVIMIISYISFLFVIFIFIHAVFELCEISNGDMKQEEFEQKLRLMHYSKKSVFNVYVTCKEWKEFKRFSVLNERDGDTEGLKKRRVINYIWKPLYSIIKEGNIQKTLKFYSTQQSRNEDQLQIVKSIMEKLTSKTEANNNIAINGQNTNNYNTFNATTSSNTAQN